MTEKTECAEHLLAKQGVFKGHGGLRGLAEASEFWREQPYGTRLYYGPGGGQYLHHSVLRSAVRALDDAAALEDAVRKVVDLWHGGDWQPDHIRMIRVALRDLKRVYDAREKSNG